MADVGQRAASRLDQPLCIAQPEMGLGSRSFSGLQMVRAIGIESRDARGREEIANPRAQRNGIVALVPLNLVDGSSAANAADDPKLNLPIHRVAERLAGSLVTTDRPRLQINVHHGGLVFEVA